MLTDRERGGSLRDGAIVQVLEVEPDVLRVRVIDDAASDSLKSLLGDNAGKIGFLPLTVKAVKLSQ